MYREYLLFLKYKFKNIRFNWLKLSFFGITIFLIVTFLGPLIKVSYTNWRVDNEIVSKSGRYDYVLNLPDKSLYDKQEQEQFIANQSLKTKLDQFFGDDLDSERGKRWDWHYSRVYLLLNLLEGTFFKISTVSPTAQFNKVVDIQDETGGERNIGATLKKGEAIVSESFLVQNENYQLNGEINLLGTDLRIVGQGKNISSYSFGSDDLGRIVVIINEKQSAYEQGGFVYVSDDQFDEWIKNQKIFDHKNYVFIREKIDFFSENQQTQIENDLSEFLGFTITKTSFDNDLHSGFKIFFTNLNLIINIVVILLVLMIVLFIFMFFIQSETARTQKYTKSLFSGGFSIASVALSYAIQSFLFFLVITIVGYFTGFYFFYEKVAETWIKSANKVPQTATISLQEIVLLAFFIPFLFALISFLYSYKRIRYLIYYDLSKFDQKKRKAHKGKLIGNSWLSAFTKKVQILRKSAFIFWIFKKNKTQITLFVFEFFLFALLLLTFFVKISFEQYISTGNNFFKSNVKNITEIASAAKVNDSNTAITEKIKFVPTEKTKDYVAVRTLDELIAKIRTLSLRGQGENNENLQFKIDQTLEVAEIQKYLNNFQINEVYINVVPYEEKNDLLVLSLDFGFNRKSSTKTTTTVDNNKVESNNLIKEIKRILFFENLFEDDSTLRQFVTLKENLLEEITVPYEERANSIWVTEQFVSSYGYNLGDYINFNLKSSSQISSNFNGRARITGIVDSSIYPAPIVFADYELLKKRNFIEKNTEPYNLIFSKVPVRHINRFLVINLDETLKKMTDSYSSSTFGDGDFIAKLIDYLTIANTKTLSTNEVERVFSLHFENYKFSLTTMFYIFIFLLAVSVLLSSIFLFEKNSKLFIRLEVIGYYKQELLKTIAKLEFLKFIFVAGFSFMISYLIFYLLAQWIYSVSLISLKIDEFQNFWYYIFGFYSLFLIIIHLIKFWLLKKEKLTKIKKFQ